MTDLADRYDELLEDLGADDGYDFDEPPAPADGDLQANKWLRRLQHLNRERDAIVQVHDAEIERIQMRRDALLAPIDESIDHLETSLGLYHEALLVADPKGPKTKHLPAGDLKSKAQQPEWVFEDQEAFLAWARDNVPGLVRTYEPVQPPDAVEKTAAKQSLTVPDDARVGQPVPPTWHGKPVPGVVVTKRPRAHQVILADGEDDAFDEVGF